MKTGAIAIRDVYSRNPAISNHIKHPKNCCDNINMNFSKCLLSPTYSTSLTNLSFSLSSFHSLHHTVHAKPTNIDYNQEEINVYLQNPFLDKREKTPIHTVCLWDNAEHQ